MIVQNFTEFRNNLAKNLTIVNEDAEIIVVSRSKGKNVVVMPLDEYNAIQETLHLVKSSKNRTRLDDALDEMKKGKYKKKPLTEK